MRLLDNGYPAIVADVRCRILTVPSRFQPVHYRQPWMFQMRLDVWISRYVYPLMYARCSAQRIYVEYIIDSPRIVRIYHVNMSYEYIPMIYIM